MMTNTISTATALAQKTFDQLINIMDKQINVLSEYKDLAKDNPEAKQMLQEIDDDLIGNVAKLDYLLSSCVFNEEHLSVIKEYRESAMELGILYKEYLVLC